MKIGTVILVALICLLSVSGCKETATSDRPNPKEYVCNEQQLKLVAEETRICSNTKYFTDYCYAVAKGTICDKIEKHASTDR